MFTALDTMYPIVGYKISKQIYSSNKTLVYHGIREKDQKPVILKLIRNEYPTFAEIVQFRNQYTITQNIEIPGIIKSYSLENYRNGYVLVMEDVGGISLKEWLLKKHEIGEKLIPLGEFFHIALSITATLELVHRHRIIHKDIKPANILIHQITKEIKLIDFSIATLLPKEIQTITNPNVLEGTLAYISPEQTGRMNRGIDYRSDFYSLGITFFELLTGQLPFTNTEPMELVYSHIAKEPPKTSSLNQNIPPILSDIVSKLIAKNAEDRYQSAYGLRHDLEVCYQQWQETGSISLFELGLKDISSRFVIPEKLYGRQHEVETLLSTFERVASGTTEMILVAGCSGIGKTAVINEVHKPIIRQQSYFVKGKYDQFLRDIPLSGLVQAFRNLIKQLLSENDEQIQHWKTKILLALGTQSQVIIDVIPELEQIIGQQVQISELSGNASQNRFNLLFQRFIQVFINKEHPLVIFLDDLQWADYASLKLIKLLMSETTSSGIAGNAEDATPMQGGLLLIGAYRDNEVPPAHPLSLTLNEIIKSGATINTIKLSPLNQANLNYLIADTLRCPEVLAISLTQMVFTKTHGNPFFTTQFLKALHDDGLITLNVDIGYWQYDITKIKTLTLTDDIVEFMAIQIERLPKHTQDVLKLAACIGNEFDLKTLSIVNEKSVIDTASDLWPSLLEGLILPQNESYRFLLNEETNNFTVSNYQLPKYKFVHDRIQQAAYSLIPQEQNKIIHLQIGLLLLSNIPVTEREDKIFELVNQFNIALEFITHQPQRNELAEMNLAAGRKALSSTSYSAAMKYLTTGINLLEIDSWNNKYELTLALYETAAEAAYLNGDFEQTKHFVEVVFAKAKLLLDKVKVWEVIVQAYGAQNQAQDAVNSSLVCLSALGVDFPNHPSKEDVNVAMEEIALLINHQNINKLSDMPEMIEAEPLAIMRILSNTIAFAYQAIPELMVLMCLKQISLSLKYGNSPLSAFAYVCYGFMLCGSFKDIELGYKLGNLGIKLLSVFNDKGIKPKVIQTFYAHISHWKQSIKESCKPLLEAYSAGLEAGDLEFASYSLKAYCYISYFSGKELALLEREMANYSQAVKQLKQDRVFYWIEIYRQTVLNLTTNVQNHCRLIGKAYNEEKTFSLHIEGKDGAAILYLYLCKLHLCYLLSDYSAAVENAENAEQYLACGSSQFVIPQFYFYSSLAWLAIYENTEPYKQEEILDKVVANQEKLNKISLSVSSNYLHKFYLVEAERCRVLKNYFEAMELYDRAITLAKENEFIHEEALANELAAKFYLFLGKDKIAKTYLIDSYYGYVRWGALVKVNDLQKRYPQLLSNIIQQEIISQNPHNDIQAVPDFSTSEKTQFSLSTNDTVIASHTSVSDMLDLASVIKASQALSGEIEIEKLLATLMEVVMENAGASKCALVLSNADNTELTVSAISTASDYTLLHTEFQSTPLDSCQEIPKTIINYVKRSRETLVIDDTNIHASLATDTYINQEQTKSLLCIPMINQSNLVGILYLENNLTTGAFTRDRLEVLKLLTTQAAISLENAILYRNLAQAKQRLEEYNCNLEEKVLERTSELKEKNQSLQQALQELKHTQIQLIQSEKMSSLGQMVAGIAHEINNPINFIHGNIVHINEYIKDILELLSIYQQEYPILTHKVALKLEKIDLEFISEDLLKIIDSMNLGSSRIRHIVLGLRNFSRLDESDMKAVNIHEGIDNTFMLLQHRLKPKNNFPEIKVLKEYAFLPKITCYPGQLNQVFMNIISNAIDALEENFINSSNEINEHPTIIIHTESTDAQTVKIKIIDNGIGIPESVIQKIFDPFFTTKSVGSGTGLGLSISYQIVVDKHKGNLSCCSELGKGSEFVIEIPIR